MDEKLHLLGFSKNLSTTYMCLLRLGESKASTIIKETGLQRSVVYTGLEELLTRGLITETTLRGIALFKINDPDALVYEAEQKKILAEKISEELKKQQGVKNREALIYEGEDIIQRVTEKSLQSQPGSTIYFLGPSKFGIQANLERYWKKYHTQRIEKEINCKILYDSETDPEIVESRNKMELCEAKFLPPQLEVPMWFNIFEDTVGMIIPSEDPPLAFIIKSKKTADALRNYFEYLWQQ